MSLEGLPVTPSNRELLKSLLDLSPYAICISDYQAKGLPMVYANANFYNCTGYSPEEALGKNCNFLQGPESDPGIIQKIRDCLQNGVGCSVRILNYDKVGTKMWNDLSLAPLRAPDGTVTHYLGVLMLKKAPSFRALYRTRTKVPLVDSPGAEGNQANSLPQKPPLRANRISRPSGMTDDEWIELRRQRRQGGECIVQPDVNAWMTLVRRSLDPRFCPSWAIPLKSGTTEPAPQAEAVIAEVAGLSGVRLPDGFTFHEPDDEQCDQRERMRSSQF
uniref:Putative LOV domain-containing protein n=1 Tax=Cymbomonas sp. BC-2016 TaxID=1799572 RepID=A0A126X3N1_9CHLO|nr:putative LOV domain-containing protein [Cymbomonas sp. BC-2016]